MSISTATIQESRRGAVRSGVRVEVLTIVWMVIEAVVSIGAGVAARSVVLTAFGLDSVIELVTGSVLLWRLTVEARGGTLARVERAENRAAWVTGIGLVLLCLYVLALALAGIVTQTHAESSLIGLGIAAVAVIGMPLLARRKRAIAAVIGSGALRGDAACSLTCAYMAATLLVGLTVNAFWGWWWADNLAALGLLWWLVPEAREALAGARAGRGGCTCDADECAPRVALFDRAERRPTAHDVHD